MSSFFYALNWQKNNKTITICLVIKMKTDIEYGYDLMLWYQKNQRDLPWRNQKDPYKIWISEIMLQQTRVESVIPYYLRFIKRLPNVKALANVEDDELKRLWQGLGYYRRAKYLKEAAIQICKQYGGKLPCTYDELIKLKGIGEYSGAAIASIAFDEEVIAMDGNVFRVFTRLLNCNDDIYLKSTRNNLLQQIKRFVNHDYGTFNQALMELGATICIPNGKPKCDLCVFQERCLAYSKQNYMNFPIKKPKKGRKQQKITVVILECNQEIWIHKRGADGLLADLYEFITLENHFDQEKIKEQFLELDVQEIYQFPNKKHVFTHVEWDIKAYYLKINNKKINGQYQGMWIKKDKLHTLPFPSAFLNYLLEVFK